MATTAPMRCLPRWRTRVEMGASLAMTPDLDLSNASLADIQQALAEGRTTPSALTRGYLERIEAYDRAGTAINSVREINPDALAIAAEHDGQRPSKRYPLAGIPILVKDNVATADRQHTTAGSLALQTARGKQDATVVKRLRAAGAVILGKANLTEFANILAIEMPSGYSSLGGQVKNPYAPLLDERGFPLVSPGGSSAGSAAAVAAGLCAAAIGTETSGSLLNPASQNGLVTVKPTRGLVSCAGVIPISHSQDTVGPLTRTVRDAAIVLNVLAARDPADPATRKQQRPPDFTTSLDPNGLSGARIGVPSDPGDPGNDVYFSRLGPRSQAAIAQALATLEAQGATLIRDNIPTPGWIGGPGTTMSILNRNPYSAKKDTPSYSSVVFLYELKHDLNCYLRDWAGETEMRTLADIVAFNAAHPEAMRFGQDLFLAAEATRGDLSEIEYKAARASDLRASRTLGLDAYIADHRLDAVVFPQALGCAIAAKAGYPSVQVPAGFTANVDGKPTPDFPLGLTFTGPAWSEPTLLRLAYAYEQAARMRRPPAGLGDLRRG